MNRPLIELFLTLALFFSAVPFASAFDAKNGTMDMAAWKKADGPVMLKGRWKAAWNRLLPPDAPGWTDETGVFFLPGLWQPGRENMTATGTATFRLSLTHIPEDLGQAALYIPDIFSVGQVWINGKRMARTGQTGNSKAEERPRTHSLLFSFTPGASGLDILIQVSNFHNARGGINQPVWFGTDAAVRDMVNRKRIMTSIISAAFLMIALVHLTLFFIGKTGTAHAWFGLYALTWAVQTLFSPAGGSPGNLAARGLPWHLPIDLTLMACAAGPPLLIMCYHLLFPHPWGRLLNRVFQAAAGGFICYILMPPANAYDPVCLGYFFFTLAGFVYLFVRMILDLINRRAGVKLLLPGFAILIFTVISDILGDTHLIQGPSVPFGLLAFILSYSACISLRLSKTFAEIRELNATLEKKDRELSELDRLKGPATLPASPGDGEKKDLLVRVMNLSLDLWTASTQTSRVEMAEQSGLWNVYIGKDGWARTQTLDRYLDPASLPKRPRWKIVVSTADFVLAACRDTDLSLRHELEDALKKFRQMV